MPDFETHNSIDPNHAYVLIVDDDRDIHELMTEVLTEDGHRVISLYDALDVATTIKSEIGKGTPVTVTISDGKGFNMPYGTAEKVASQLETAQVLGKIGLILCTGQGEHIPDKLRSVFDAVLHKPFDLDLFLGTVLDCHRKYLANQASATQAKDTTQHTDIQGV